MRGITRDCIVEMFDRKIFYLFGIITLLVIVGILFTVQVEFHSFGSGGMELSELNEAFGNPLMKFFAWFLSFLVFIGVLGSAGLLPNMLIRGRADYYLSKPISRTSLLLNKLFGVWLTYGGLILVCGALTYLAIVLVHGGFEISVIYLFIFALLSFFVWLTIVFFASIITGSQSMSITAAFLVWALHKVLSSYKTFEDFFDSQSLKAVMESLYFIVPKNSEFFEIGGKLALGRDVQNWSDFYTTLLTSLIVLLASIIIFRKKNY